METGSFFSPACFLRCRGSRKLKANIENKFLRQHVVNGTNKLGLGHLLIYGGSGVLRKTLAVLKELLQAGSSHQCSASLKGSCLVMLHEHCSFAECCPLTVRFYIDLKYPVEMSRCRSS